jgi:hypothetical protein
MGRDAQSNRRVSVRTGAVRGEPYHIDGKTLVPVARVVSYGKAKGFIGSDRVSGKGVGFAVISPLAMEVRTAEGEQRIVIRDTTAAALRGLIVMAVVMTVLFATIRGLGRRRRRAGAK